VKVAMWQTSEKYDLICYFKLVASSVWLGQYMPKGKMADKLCQVG
jgi:hypothetical protein